MLCIRIDGREVETTPVSLARMVLDGTVDRRVPSRTSGGESEQSLEQSLGSVYCEALSSELLQRLHAMYSLDDSAVDVQELRVRVEDLCQWRWTSPQVAARWFWVAAWLNELVDRSESAASFYDAFLQASSGESHLRLLAYNNRGVLRIRLGRLEGVQDLARAAIPDGGLEGSNGAPVPAKGLPVACLNLLNLINVSLGLDNLKRAVDEELVDFFLHVRDELRAHWLGPESSEESRTAEEGGRATPSGDTQGSLLILRDPTFRRLNKLTAHLAAQARRLAAGQSQGTMHRLSLRDYPVALSLWDSRAEGEGPAKERSGNDHPPYGTGEHDRYTEAASLLLSDEIPSSLVRRETLLSRAERSAQEELADIESHLDSSRYEIARSRLQAQRKILASLNDRGRFAGLLARVDTQLERVAQLEVEKERFEFQRVCARLVSDVEQFCRLTDPCRAEKELHDLGARLQRLRAQPSPQTGKETASLLDELNARVERHMRRLRRLEIRRRIRGPLRQVRQSWPTDWTAPVPESVYQTLAQCHLNDPEGWIEDWPRLKSQLDAHQGRYHLRTALAALQANEVAWDPVEDELVKALTLNPDLWLTVAPLFGLSCSRASADTSEATMEAQIALQAAASRLFNVLSPGGRASGAGRDSGPMCRAGRLLTRVFRQMAANPTGVLRLWQCAEATLWPVLEKGDIGAIAEARAMAEKCLDHWPVAQASVPGPVDPRNPVNLFLESCGKARCLVEAEQSLHVRPPRLDEAQRRYAELIGWGLETRDQLRRVVTGLYLAQFHQQDSAQMQRQVLTRLETWAAAVPEEAGQRLGEQDIVREIEGMRAAPSGGQIVPVTGGRRPDDSAEDVVEHEPKVDGFDDTRDGSEQDHHNLPREFDTPQP